MKYFLGFLRSQLSTTTTILLIFGPKVILRAATSRILFQKRRGKIQYKLLEGTVYINPATVFCPNVTMNADHSISTEESQWLCDSNWLLPDMQGTCLWTLLIMLRGRGWGIPEILFHFLFSFLACFIFGNWGRAVDLVTNMILSDYRGWRAPQ